MSLTICEAAGALTETWERITIADRRKLARKLMKLAESWPALREPDFKPLKGMGGAWELRTLGRSNIRLYFTVIEPNAIVVFGHHKSGDKPKKTEQATIEARIRSVQRREIGYVEFHLRSADLAGD
jgi:hypothetical protein